MSNKTHSVDYGVLLLKNQLKDLTRNPVDGFSVGLVDDSNIYEWQCILEGPQGTDYEGMAACAYN